MSNIKLTRRNLMALGGAALATPALVGRASAAPEVTLRLHHFLPPMANAHRHFFEPWAKEIAEQSEGRIEVQLFPSMQLGGKPPQLADQARQGIADITWTIASYTPARFPVAETVTLPFMVTSAEKTSVAMHKMMESHGKDEYRGVKPLAFHVHAAGKFHTREKAVETVADLKGQKIRMPTPNFGALLENFGVEPIFFPITEMAVGLANGVIDGTCLPYEVVPAFKLHELTKHHSAAAPGSRGLYTSAFALLMNERSYEGMPEDLRGIIDANSGIGLSQRIGKSFDDFEQFGIDAINKQGNSIHQIAANEVQTMRDATAPIYDEWKKTLSEAGYDADAVVNEYNALLDAE